MPLCVHLFSAASSFIAPCRLFPPLNPSPLSPSLEHRQRTWTIRMGGGPRTFPGGVSKWEWKRMQAKKSKQLLKARLCRERQIYEMRRRAELRAAAAELERPWEPVASAPALFSVRADEQVKVLADRFNRPGGYDLWTERDGPQVFRAPDGVTSARFFPKGAVHSIKPYEAISSREERPTRPGKSRRRRKDETADVGIDLGEELLRQGERKVEWDQKADSFGVKEELDSLNTDPEMSNAVWWKDPGSINSDFQMNSGRWKETGSSNTDLDMSNARGSKEPSNFKSDSRVRNARWSKEPRSLNGDSQVGSARRSKEPRSLNSDSQARNARWSEEPSSLYSDSQVRNARWSKQPSSLYSDSQVRNSRWGKEPRSLNSDSQVKNARWSEEPRRLNSDSQVKNARWSEEPSSLYSDSQVRNSRSKEPRSLNSDSQVENARWSDESRGLNSDSEVRNARWRKEPKNLSSASKLSNARWRKKSENLSSGLEKSNARWSKKSRGLSSYSQMSSSSWRESGSLSDSELSNPRRRMTGRSNALEMSNVSTGRINDGRETRVMSSPGGGLKSSSSGRRGGLRGDRYQLDSEVGFRGSDGFREDDF